MTYQHSCAQWWLMGRELVALPSLDVFRAGNVAPAMFASRLQSGDILQVRWEFA